MNVIRLPALILLSAFVWLVGCTTTKPDPLASWRFMGPADRISNKTITDDYQGYLQRLPPDKRKYAGPIQYFEGENGQHAVLIWIGMNDKVWRHILIYDKEDRRIKTINYKSGNYSS